MQWTDIAQLINGGKWEQARREINRLKQETVFDDTAWILEAAVCEHENNPDGVYDCITEGLKYNCRNYELYVMLGN